jgi:hypothetical protein
MEQQDSITVGMTHIEEVQSDRADLFVTIKGKSLVTGQEAFKRAIEVRQLVEGLTGFGLSESDIFLEGVQAEVTTGVISKSSSATYRLRICCHNLDNLADILGIITSQKNTNLTQLLWKYSNPEQLQSRLLETGLTKLKQKAEIIATALDVDLLGIASFEEQYLDSEASPPVARMQLELAATERARRITKEDLGLEVSHSKQVTLKLTATYRVSPLKR